jgi:hypothetical protein
MKKFLSVFLVALALGGCAQLSAISQGISLATKTVTNPVTKADEAKVELAFGAVVQLLLVYKKACISGAADKNCKDNIRQIQAYTRQAPPLIAQLRSFVDHNDQINASVVYNQLSTLYVNVKTAANNLGVQVGG